MSAINSSRSDLRLGIRFCAIGMGVASLEEFISQGVLKHTLFGWVIPAFIAFVPFLVTSALIHRLLRKKIKVKTHLELFYYMISGGIGLFVEWFLIGLSPWSSSSGTNPVLLAVFQLGLFSFWGSVAFAPRILIDKRTAVVSLVRWFKRSLAAGFVIIYLATFAANRQPQFAIGIISILTIFLALNVFYIRYIRSWGPTVPARPKLV